MTILPAKFKTATIAVLLSLSLGASVLPAHAQEAPTFNFELQLPGGGEGGATTFGQRHGGDDVERGGRHRCLTNREVRRGVEANGYSRVEIRRDLPRDRVEVVARYGNWLYSMRVDKCDGTVDRFQRIRRVQGGGFGLQFNFGN